MPKNNRIIRAFALIIKNKILWRRKNIMKTKRIISVFIVMTLVIVTFLTGCGNSTSNSASSTSNSSNSPLIGSKDEKYVMVTFVSGIEYWKGAFKGMQDAAKYLGVTAQYTGANEYDINQQVTVLEQVIAQKPSGILLTCINPDALKDPINRAIQQGIPVITFDADSPNSLRYSYLGTSNYNAGVIAARTLAKLVGEKGEVGVITIPGQLNHEERTAGFKDTIAKEFPNMKVVSVQDGKSDQVASAQAMASMMQAHPNLVGVFTTEASTGVGAATAVKEANKVGKVHIVSFDTDKGTLDNIKAGVIDATIAQGTWNMGYWGMMFLYHLKHDLVRPIDGDWKTARVAPLPPIVDTGVNVVTKDNVDYFYSK
ncbi:substrate-binding domain-containing protein [Thermoanaerobacter pentosaceus]|uniref:Ribose transport system substrate-binding protein n=2 Tax=Thermoanaerobacter TaxID=1754 RepID=A0ABT9M2U5_9THEO|nr:MULTISPECIES: substrate-binding domain-containing protein [Thermoanaerobacter]MDP9750426.1 ribose transport system substrate-binding protein [Thermoanaerobacter pentosaceus]